MAKPTPLFQRGEQGGQQAPAVAAEIAAAKSSLATLEAGRGAAALSAMTEGGDVSAIAKLDAEVTSLRTKLFNLQAAHRAASERDARHAADARYRQQQSDFGAFVAALAQKDAEVGKYCTAIKVAAESYRAIFELSAAVAALVPEACKFPSGFSAFAGQVEVDGRAQAAPLDHLAAHEMYRHSGIPGR